MKAIANFQSFFSTLKRGDEILEFPELLKRPRRLDPG